MGSGLDLGELRDGLGWILIVERGAKTVVVWVRLGTKMEVVLLGVEALVWVRRKKKKRAGFQWGRRRRMGAGCSGFTRSLLDDQKAKEEKKAGGFYQGLDAARHAEGF